jgi:hypothetical protein
MERERGAGQVGLGEPKEHLLRDHYDQRRSDVRYGLLAIVIELQNCTEICGACLNRDCCLSNNAI